MDCVQGIIGAYRWGTLIESWSRSHVLEECGIEPSPSHSSLWNGMVAPYTRLTLFGFLWYQGENNAVFNNAKYGCTFPALVEDYRAAFRVPDAAFGFVQLATVSYGSPDLRYAQLRWHQTADEGTVPNPRLKHTFMAVAIDTYDEESQAHPRYKPIVAARLAATGLRTAYGLEDFPEQGPQMVGATSTDAALLLTYNQAVHLNATSLSGFYVCCEGEAACLEATEAAAWPEVVKEAVSQVRV